MSCPLCRCGEHVCGELAHRKPLHDKGLKDGVSQSPFQLRTGTASEAFPGTWLQVLSAGLDQVTSALTMWNPGPTGHIGKGKSGHVRLTPALNGRSQSSFVTWFVTCSGMTPSDGSPTVLCGRQVTVDSPHSTDKETRDSESKLA